jgi:hypothetical protein
MPNIQVAAALTDFEAGHTTDFDAEKNADTYEVHRGVLNSLHDEKPMMFQRIMEKLYKDAL